MTNKKDPPRVTKRIEKCRPSQITVDPRVQRPLDRRRVKELVEGWSDLAFGVPHVSRRADGTLHPLDGQHRWEALCQLGRGGESFDALVYRGLTLVEEAQIFGQLNDVKRLTPLELFAVAVIEGEEVAVACKALLEKYGLVAERSRPNGFIAVNALREKWVRDELSTERAIQTAVDSWGRRKVALDGRIFSALANLYFRYGDSVSLSQLADRLKKGEETSPGDLIGRGRTLAKIRSMNVHDAIADVLVQIYNFQRQTRKLPRWE